MGVKKGSCPIRKPDSFLSLLYSFVFLLFSPMRKKITDRNNKAAVVEVLLIIREVLDSEKSVYRSTT